MALLCNEQFMIAAGGNLMSNGRPQNNAALRRTSWRTSSSFAVKKKFSSSKCVVSDRCQIHHVRAVFVCVSRIPNSVAAPRDGANIPHLLHSRVVTARWCSGVSRADDLAISGKLPRSLAVLPRHDNSPFF